MAKVCELTGRKTRTGNRIKHNRGKAGGVSGTWSRKAPKTRRTWKPNLRYATVMIDGTVKKMRVSMKAYKKLRKEGLLVQK